MVKRSENVSVGGLWPQSYSLSVRSEVMVASAECGGQPRAFSYSLRNHVVARYCLTKTAPLTILGRHRRLEPLGPLDCRQVAAHRGAGGDARALDGVGAARGRRLDEHLRGYREAGGREGGGVNARRGVEARGGVKHAEG